MNIPVLILCYKRVDELRQTVDAAIRLKPRCLYFHLHAAPDAEGQKQVEAVLDYINSVDYPKMLKYSSEPLGCRNSMRNALSWIANELVDEPFIILEDDIVLTATDEELTELLNRITALDKEHTLWVHKFGEQCNTTWAVFWGWATNTHTALYLSSYDLQELTYEQVAHICQEPLHWEGIKEIYRRKQSMAWDDEFYFIIRAVGDIELVKAERPLTKHIGTVSTRTSELDVPFMDTHVTFENGVMKQ